MGNPFKARVKLVHGEIVVIDKKAEKIEKKAEPVVAAPVVEVPEGTIAEVLAWVDEDAEKAKLALSAENQNAKRKSLIKELKDIIEGN